MKKTFLTFVLIFGFQLSADNHLPANYSMYQTNFLFNCPVAERCFAAFDKYMNSKDKNFNDTKRGKAIEEPCSSTKI